MSRKCKGVLWFRKESYPRALDVMEDGSLLPPTYEAWHETAMSLRRRMEAAGVEAIDVPLDPDVFDLWCRRNGLHKSSEGRYEFINEYLGSGRSGHAPRSDVD